MILMHFEFKISFVFLCNIF